MTNPLVVAAQDSTTGYTGIGAVEDAHQLAAAIRSGDWADGALGGAGVALEALSLTIDPLGTLASWGVAWLIEHVRPLREALDQLAGDADQVAAQAATWHTVAASVAAARQEYADRLCIDVAGWFGATGDAYRSRGDEHLDLLDGLSAAAGGIAAAVEGAGLIVATVRELVRDLIAEFVAVLAVRLPQWLAMEGITLGVATPLVAGQVANLVRNWAERIQQHLRRLLHSLRGLSSMLDRLRAAMERLTERAHALARRLLGHASPPGKAPPGEPATPASHAPFVAPATYLDRHGRLSNGTYTVSNEAMLKHLALTARPGRSVFLSGVHAEKAVLDAAAFADAHQLWIHDKAKVLVVNGPVGVIGRTGELTHYINVYRNDRGAVHGSPGGAP
ncbi:hypothetical protein AB0C07_28555 [Actinoplanes missouriensis]|uniref:WXG100-like domain-containing protein n=1 Tax=Actinoplanes missouriensis TaxID=1866 RepID=UPI0033C8F1A5